MTVWFATGNMHKKAEIEKIFPGVEIKIPADAGITDFDPDETGSTFAENALIKARALRRLLCNHKTFGTVTRERHPRVTEPCLVLADDSGLCVDALGGRPGIYSARYGSEGGKKLKDAERNALLLGEIETALKAAPSANRKARFVCAMALLYGEDRFTAVQETLEGEIVESMAAARGCGGFGYDPILYLPEQGRTAAELSEEEKNECSHRGKAGRLIAKLLRR